MNLNSQVCFVIVRKWKTASCLLFLSFADSPVSGPKKLDLTKENLNALLGQGSFKQKTSSTFSRGSAQTSGGRGPGKGENMEMTEVGEGFITQDVEEHTSKVSILTSHLIKWGLGEKPPVNCARYFYLFPLQVEEFYFIYLFLFFTTFSNVTNKYHPKQNCGLNTQYVLLEM